MTRRMPRRPEPEIMDSEPGADAYADADFSEVNQAFVDRLVDLAGNIERAETVDLGTGPADIPIRVLRSRPAWHVTAIDASAPMVDIARRAVSQAGLDRAIDIVLVDAKSTGLEGQAFDVVFSNSILHHVSDPKRFWLEVKRLVRPGGCIFLRDLARPFDEKTACAIVERYAATESEQLRIDYYNSLLASYTVDEVESQLAAAGLGGLHVKMVTDRHLDVFGRPAGCPPVCTTEFMTSARRSKTSRRSARLLIRGSAKRG